MRERNRKGIGAKKRAKKGKQYDKNREKGKEKNKIKLCKPARILTQEMQSEFKRQISLFEQSRKRESGAGCRFHSYSFLFSPSEAIVFEVVRQNGEIEITGFLFTEGNFFAVINDSIPCEGSSRKVVIANCYYDDGTLMLKYDILIIYNRKIEKQIFREEMILSEAYTTFSIDDILNGKKRYKFLPPVHGKSYLRQIKFDLAKEIEA